MIDYTLEEVTDGALRYDAVLDIGGNRRLSRLRRILDSSGRLVIIGGETGGRWLGGYDRGFRAQVWSAFVGQKMGGFMASENTADLVALQELADSGSVIPAIDRTYPLAEVPAAIRHLQEGGARGKVVIAV